MNSFTCTDSPAPQKVRIDWSIVTIDDEDNTDRPDERDDGFWPSLDPDAAGYIGDPIPGDAPGARDAEFAHQQAFAQERMADFDAGVWGYIGVVARAVVHIPIGGQSFRVLKLESAGLWGIESDCGDEYKRQVFDDEKASLLSELRTMGRALDLAGGVDEEGLES